MKKKTIPDEVREEALHAIAQFNRKTLAGTGYSYVPRFQGKYLYLHREEGGEAMPICRLEYKGPRKLWEFSIYKYSSEQYDPEEFFFPGAGLVDGTLEGAMKAGMEAYD